MVQLGDILARFEAAGSVENLSFGERLKKLADSKTGLVLSSFDCGVQPLKTLLPRTKNNIRKSLIIKKNSVVQTISFGLRPNH